MSDFEPTQVPSQSQDSNIPNYEQNPLPGQFTDLKDSTGLSTELQEVFGKGLEYLKDNPVLSADVRRMEERVIEVVEYPGNVNLFGTTKKTLDKGDLKRVHGLEGYEFKRNGPDAEILKISVRSLKDTASAREYVNRIEDDFDLYSEKANTKVGYAMQGVERRKNLDVSFFDQSRVYRDRARQEAYKTIEDITFSFEDAEDRKICAMVVKKALGGVFVSVVDFRNPDRARMFVTETPVLLENFDNKKFDSLKQRLSRHVNSMKRDMD